MREDAVRIENERLEGLSQDNYPWFHERHRIFPKVFEGAKYDRILDVAAGMGIVGKRIHELYPCFMLCNDISSESLRNLTVNKINTISFDLDDPDVSFPFRDGSFDAIVSLATVEHIIHTEEHMRELKRILKKGGHLYISAPNYSSIHFVIPYLLKGRSFHNPLDGGIAKYEFYAHVRYFTYKTLLEYVTSFGFVPDKVYLPLPEASSRYKALKKRSSLLAFGLRSILHVLYKVLPPRWAFHPVLRFTNPSSESEGKVCKPQTVVL